MSSSGLSVLLERYQSWSLYYVYVALSGGYVLPSIPDDLLHKISIKISNMALALSKYFKLTWLISLEINEEMIKWVYQLANLIWCSPSAICCQGQSTRWWFGDDKTSFMEYCDPNIDTQLKLNYKSNKFKKKIYKESCLCLLYKLALIKLKKKKTNS